MTKNLLIVSSESGSGDAAKVDVFDALLFHDNDVDVISTNHKDLYIVRTNLEPLNAHSLILRSLPRHISRIIPVQDVCSPNMDEIKKTCIKLLEKRQAGSFALKAKVRGSPLSASSLEREVGAFVKQMSGLSVDLDHPDLVVYIDVIDDLVTFAALPADFPISVKSLRQSMLSGIGYMPEESKSNEEKEG